MKLNVDEREFATILAALRYWQRKEPLYDSLEADIATDCGTLDPLTADQIDSLCERLNTSVTRDDRAAEIISLANRRYREDGEIEVDSDALISEGNDNGCYVEGWLWVDFTGTPFDKEAEEEDA